MRPPPPLSELPRYPVTGGLALLAIGITVAKWSGVDLSPILVNGHVREGQVWRFLASILPHGDIFHLFFDVYMLWVFGTLLEQVFGTLGMLAATAIFGLGSGAAEFALFYGGIGLSGVVYGLFTMLWVLERHDRRFSGAVDKNTVKMLVAWFFICIVGSALGLLAIANVAHGMGALLGALVGWAISLRGPRRALAAAGLLALTAASVAGAVTWRPHINLAKAGHIHEFQMGYAAAEAERYDQAVRWYSDAVRMSPKDADSWHNLSLAYQHLGRIDDALAAAERALALAPGDNKTRLIVENLKRVRNANRLLSNPGNVPSRPATTRAATTRATTAPATAPAGATTAPAGGK